MIITRNGRAAAVLLSPEEFDRLTYRERFRAALREGLADVEAGRIISDQELGIALARKFGGHPR